MFETFYSFWWNYMTIAKVYSAWGGFEAYNMLGMMIWSLSINHGIFRCKMKKSSYRIKV